MMTLVSPPYCCCGLRNCRFCNLDTVLGTDRLRKESQFRPLVVGQREGREDIRANGEILGGIRENENVTGYEEGEGGRWYGGLEGGHSMPICGWTHEYLIMLPF